MSSIVNGVSQTVKSFFPSGSFLFTSESVGEGHPDKIASVSRAPPTCRRW